MNFLKFLVICLCYAYLNYELVKVGLQGNFFYFYSWMSDSGYNFSMTSNNMHTSKNWKNDKGNIWCT